MTNSLQAQLNLAKAPNITPTQAGHLAADNHFEVRAAVAANPSTAGAILRYLSEDANRNVREAVLRNRSTPLDVREAAIDSGDRAAMKLAYEKAPESHKVHLQPRLVENSDETLADLVSRVRADARRRAFEKMGAALGAEDAELVEAW